MSHAGGAEDSGQSPFPGELERQVVQVFVDGVKVLGLPKSLGEIYGLIFISPDPLSLDDLVEGLGMSKGSASQGLRALKGLGAIREISVEGSRRTHYVADIELKRLVGGFIREQVRPHLESGQTKIARLLEGVGAERDVARRDFYHQRIEKLQSWMRRGRMVLPVLQKVLGQ